MAATRTPSRGAAPSRGDLESLFQGEGLSELRWWSNGAGDTYDWHEHPYHKVLVCSQGSIVFHTRKGDIELVEGDRLDIDPGTEHAATVGPEGVACVEAATSP